MECLIENGWWWSDFSTMFDRVIFANLNFVRFFERFAFASRLGQLANPGLQGCVFLEGRSA